MQGPWPFTDRQLFMNDLIERAGGRACGKHGSGRFVGGGGGQLVVEIQERLARQLLTASYSGDLNNVQWALQQRADPNSQAKDGNRATALHLASASGAPECVRLLLQTAALPTVEDVRGETPIDAAIAAGSNRAVIELLSHGDKDVVAMLHSEYHRWSGALFAVLQSAPSPPQEVSGRSATRAHDRRFEETKQILDQICAAGTPEWKATTAATELRRALFMCISRHWHGGVNALLTGLRGPFKIDPNTRDPKSRRTALELATAMYEHQTHPDVPAISQLLRQCGADPSVCNPCFAEWALQLSAARNDQRGVAYWHEKVDELDWREPPPPNDPRGGLRGTALMLAAMEGHDEVVQALMGHGAAPWLMDAGGRNAGQLARLRGHRRTAAVLEARATAYVTEQVSRLPTQQAKRNFMASLMPPPWAPPAGWSEAGESGESRQPSPDSEEDPHEPADKQRKVDMRKLIVAVLSARDLVSDFFQFQIDPYVVVTLLAVEDGGGGDYYTLETKQSQAIPNTDNPEWNKEFNFQIERDDIITIAVMDEGVSDDALVGRIDIKLSKWFSHMQKGKTVKLSRRLQMQPRGAQSGVLDVSLRFASLRHDGSDEEVAVRAKQPHELTRDGTALARPESDGTQERGYFESIAATVTGG